MQYKVKFSQTDTSFKTEYDKTMKLEGAPGLTPYIKNGTWWIGEEDTGVKASGQNGYTPKKGVDYWTPQDIAEIKADVEAMVGDIDAVLDSIIAKQTEVLGGDS